MASGDLTLRVRAEAPLAGAALAVGVALAFWPVVSGDRSFFHLDLRYEHVPVWHVVQRALLSGGSPFWIEGQYCGNPLLFHQEAAPFYPLTVPLLATGAPAHRLTDLFSLFHFWLAGFASFLLLRDRGARFLAALFGGVAWMLSARMVQTAIWPNAVAVLSLLPLLLLGLFRVGEGRRRSGILWSSIAGGLCLLLSRPQALLGAAPLVAAVAGAAVLLSRSKATALKDVVTIGLLAAALGAPALLPSALLYPETSRSLGLDRQQRDPYPLTFEGDLDQVFLPVDGPARWPEAAAYPGVLVFFLFATGIVFAVRRRPDFPRPLFLVLVVGAACGLVFAFGEGGPLRLIADLPLIRGFRVPARYLVSWSLALAIGAGLVLSNLLTRARRPVATGILLTVGLAADLVIHARGAAQTAPAAVYSIEPRLASLLKERLGNDEAGFPRRVWSTVFPPPVWSFADAEKLDFAKNLEPLYGAIPMYYGLEAIAGEGPSTKRWNLLFRRLNERVAGLGGTGALVSELRSGAERRPQLLVERFDGLPRAIVVPEWIVVPRSRAIPATLDRRLDPRRTAVLEEGTAGRAHRPWTPSPEQVHLRSRAPGRISLEVTLPDDGVLVLFNAYDRGWTATVDGLASRVLPVDAAFQGIRLPPGRHAVELRYRPRGVAAGIAAAAIGVVGFLLSAFRLPA